MLLLSECVAKGIRTAARSTSLVSAYFSEAGHYIEMLFTKRQAFSVLLVCELY